MTTHLPPPLGGVSGHPYENLAFSAVADLDLDGKPELVTGNTAYRADGTVWWSYDERWLSAHNLPTERKLLDGFVAIANLDSDPYPEIVVAYDPNAMFPFPLIAVYVYGSTARIRVMGHDGTIKYDAPAVQETRAPEAFGYRGPGVGMGVGGPPTLADFDGDGVPDIARSNASALSVQSISGGSLHKLWSVPINDGSSAYLGVSAFDFFGNRRYQAVHADEAYLRVLDGRQGDLLAKAVLPSLTGTEYPVVADVDGDGQADIVSTQDYTPSYTTQPPGVYVYSGMFNDWGPTRKIWNQYGYHVTNVNDDGTIPVHEKPSWLANNTWQANVRLTAEQRPDLTASRMEVTQPGGPGTTSVKLRVGNAGPYRSPAPPLDAVAPVVRFYARAAGSQAESYLGLVNLTRPLAKGEFQDIGWPTSGNLPPFTFATPATGDFEIIARVNQFGAIKECRLDNNDDSVVAGLIDHDTTPPVVATPFRFEPPTAAAGQPMEVHTTVTDNLGVDPDSIRVFVNGVGLPSERVAVSYNPAEANPVVHVSALFTADLACAPLVRVVAADRSGNQGFGQGKPLGGTCGDTNAPTADVSLSTDTLELGGSVNVTVTASDVSVSPMPPNTGLASVTLYEGASDKTGTPLFSSPPATPAATFDSDNISRTPAKEGVYLYFAGAVDRAGHDYLSAAKTVTVHDSTPPHISVTLFRPTTPAEGQTVVNQSTIEPAYVLVNERILRMTVAATDLSGIAPASRAIQIFRGLDLATPVATIPGSAWGAAVDYVLPSAGNYTIRVACDDASSGANHAVFTFHVVAVGSGDPTLDLTRLTADPLYVNSSVVFGFETNQDPATVSASVRNLATQAVTAANIDAAQGRITFPASLNTVKGDFALTVTAGSPVAVTRTQRFTVHAAADDVTPPTITIDFLPGASVPGFYNGFITSVITVNDMNTLASVSLKINGRPRAFQPFEIAPPLPLTNTLTAMLQSPPECGGRFDYEVTAVDASRNQAVLTKTLTISGAGAPPTAEITSLPDADTQPKRLPLVTKPTDIVGKVRGGTISGAEHCLRDWTLDLYQQVNSPDEVGKMALQFIRRLGSGVGEIEGVLGRLDPTLLKNGPYTLELTATDNFGSETVADQDVRVLGDFKVGLFTLSFVDLSVPVRGFPLTVTRTYDSRDIAAPGDFGPGWRYALSDLDVAVESDRSVTLNLPDGRRTTFIYTLEPSKPYIPGGYQVKYVPAEPGIYDTLEMAFPDDDGSATNGDQYANLLMYPPCPPGCNNPPPPFWPGWGAISDPAFTPPAWVLKTKDGTRFVIRRDNISNVSGDPLLPDKDDTYGFPALRRVIDPNGNHLDFERDTDGTLRGLHSSAGPAIFLLRDGGSISRMVYLLKPPELQIPPASPIADVNDSRLRNPDFLKDQYVVDYYYDAATGDLVGVKDAQGNYTSFNYREPDPDGNIPPPHYLTSIVDPLNRRGVRTEYDADGRMTAQVDALGHRVVFSHLLSAREETITNRVGLQTLLRYDTQGRVISRQDIATLANPTSEMP